MQRCSAAPNELQANKTQQNINTEQRAQRAREIKTTPPKEADDRLIEATTKLQEVGNLKAKRFGQLAPHRSSERSRSNANAMHDAMQCTNRECCDRTCRTRTGTNASDKGPSRNRDGTRHARIDSARCGEHAPQRRSSINTCQACITRV